MTLSENPYFQQWIARNLARMDSGLRDKHALTCGATRIQCMSSDFFAGTNPALERVSMEVLTNLMGRLQKRA